MSQQDGRRHRGEDSSPLSARRELLAVAGGLLALALVMTYPLVMFLPRGLPNDLGDPLLNTWTLAWVASRIPYGLAGVWDAPIFFPYRWTLAFSEHLIGVALFTAPLQWLSGNPILVYNLAFLASYVLAGTGMYLLARELTGRAAAAWLGGLAFAFHPYRVVHWSHLQMLMWGWMPIALWGLHRYFATGSRRALVAFVAAFTLQALSNGYFFYFLSAAVAVAALFELARSTNRRRACGHLALAAASILLLLAPVMHAYATVRREYGLRRSLGEAIGYSADVASYGSTTRALWWWGPRLPRQGGERELFPGLTIVALAAVAYWPSRGRRREWRAVTLYTAIGVVGFVLSLGPEPRAWGRPLAESGPYLWLWQYLPGFDGLRVPARWATLVYLSLSVMGAIGARRLLGALPRRVAPAVALALAAALLAEGYARLRVVSFRPEPPPGARAAYLWLRQAPPGGMLELPLGAWDQGQSLVRELGYQYGTLIHGKRIVNGFSGYYSPLRQFLLDSPVLSPPELPAAVEGLRALGVRYVVLHLDAYEDRDYAFAVYETLRSLEGRADATPATEVNQVAEHAAFGDVVVFRLAGWEGPPLGPTRNSICRRPIDRARFVATVSHGPHRLEYAFDDDFDTRWMSEAPQEGGEEILIEFDPPQRIAAVRIELGPYSWGDYPRHLTVEGQPAPDRPGANGFMTLFRGRVMTQMMLGLLREPDRAPIEIPLPGTRLTALRLRQGGQARPWYWSINELRVCAP